MDVVHIPRNYKGQRIIRDVDEYCKIEIESYDPVNSFNTYSLSPKLSNCRRLTKEDIRYYTSKNKGNWKYSAKKKVKSGSYRVEALVFTSKGKNQGFSLNSKQTSSTTNTYDIIPTITIRPYTMKEVIDVASRVKIFYEKNNRLPNYVTIRGHDVYRNELNYLLSKCLHLLGEGKNPNKYTDVITPPSPINDEPKEKNTLKKGKIYKKSYLSDAKDSYLFIEKNNRIYNYIVTSRGYMTASTQVMAFSYILEFYKRRKRLPNYVIVWNYRGKKLTNTKYSETTTIDKIILDKDKIRTSSYDEYLRRIEIGKVNVPKNQNMTITITGTYDCKFIALYYKKIIANSGDTKNKGNLTIKSANYTMGDGISGDTLNFNILNKPGVFIKGGFEQTKNNSGLIFEYRDRVNCYLSDCDGKTDLNNPVFGGYISDAKVSDDIMTVSISCAGRGVDGSKRSLLKELAIGGAITDNNNVYRANDYYSALRYLASGVEIPYFLSNIKEIQESIPNKKGVYIDLTKKNTAKLVKATNATKTATKSGVVVRNGRAAKTLKKKKEKKKKKKKAKSTLDEINPVGAGKPATVTSPLCNGTCGYCGWTPRASPTFINQCVNTSKCDKSKGLTWRGGSAMEWRCKSCGVDYCGKCGRDKKPRDRYLTKTGSGKNRNNPKEIGIPGQVQVVTLFDSKNYSKDRQAKGWAIHTTHVFEITYGLGKKGYNEKTKEWIPLAYDEYGKKIPNTGKLVKHKAAEGYNKDVPAKFHIELVTSEGPKTKLNKANFSSNKWGYTTIEFTDTDVTSKSDNGSSISTSGKVTRINPIWAYNTFKKASINFNEFFIKTKPKYLRQINLRYRHQDTNVLYDRANKTDYKMIVKSILFRQGESYAPEVITTSGQKINETISTILKTLRLIPYWDYKKTRKNDRLMLKKEAMNVRDNYLLDEGINGNILGVESINYSPVSDLLNSITKIYKVPSGRYGHVTSKDIKTFIQFGEHQDLEVLNEDTGINYARKLAVHDGDKNKTIKHSYTLKVSGYRNVKIGDYLVCKLLNEKLNDTKPLKSHSWSYDPEKRPRIVSTYGMGQADDKTRSSNFFKKIRASLPEKKTFFSGGSAEEVYEG